MYKSNMEDMDAFLQPKKRTIPTELGYVDAAFPRGSGIYMISAETQASILDQFYFIVVFKCFPVPNGVGFDPTKVLINPDDSEILWDMLFSHLRKFFAKDQAEERANEIWERIAPAIEVTIPKGIVRLLDGYIRFS